MVGRRRASRAVPKLPELLVAGRERPYFDFFYDVMAGEPRKLPARSRDQYARGDSRHESLKAGFDWYRAFESDAAHNREQKTIDVPILYLRGDAGGRGPDEYVAGLRAAGAADVQSGVLANSGEYAPEEAPSALVAALRTFREHCTRRSAESRMRPRGLRAAP
jgi:pimeloyl-ACP methyl ester carboxylesterase